MQREKKFLDHELGLAVGGAGATQMGWALSEKQDVYIHKSGRFAKMKTYTTGTSVRKIRAHTHRAKPRGMHTDRSVISFVLAAGAAFAVLMKSSLHVFP